jgi:hypothetical protein
MIFNVRVMPKASRNLIKEENGALKVYLTKPAYDGMANKQLIELLAKHLKVRKYQVEILSGHKSKDKVIKVNDA